MDKASVRTMISRLMFATGLLHVAVIPVVYWDAMSLVVDDGVFNGVPDSSGNADTAFWYLFAGFALLLASVLVHRIERRSVQLHRWIGWALVAIGGFGSVCKPASPFWLVATVGAFALNRARGEDTGRPIIGRLLGVIAVGHTLGVVTFYWDGLGDIVGSGVFDAAPDSADVPDAAFWFSYSGLAVLILAGLVRWVERNDRGVLASVGWSLVALGGCGVIVKPTSGLWIVLALGVVTVLRARFERADLTSAIVLGELSRRPTTAPLHEHH